jgi:IS30 family transposase
LGIRKNFYNIALAADTPQGLTVPVIKDADRKGIIEIWKELGALSAAARDGKIKGPDMQGAISRLPDVEGDKPKRQKFKRYPIGFFHIDIAEVQTGEGKLFLFVGIDRTSKFAVAQLVATADRKTAWEFLQHLLEAVPYEVHTVLTDNGIQFAERPRNRSYA